MSDEIKGFQRELLKAIKDGYEGHHSEGQEQWSFSGAFLFSLTVISTIGYGNLSPRTEKGKVLCIIYAIIGNHQFTLLHSLEQVQDTKLKVLLQLYFYL